MRFWEGKRLNQGPLETHGFVSFGYLKSRGNNWLGETIDGTDEFWEAASNVIARPMNHLRLGAQ